MMRSLTVTCAAALLALSTACAPEGCLSDTPQCKVPPPCPRVAFACSADAGALAVKVIDAVSQRPGGWDGLGTVGDVKLSNGLVEVVIAQLGSQNYLDPNGGSILDITPAGQAKDVINNIYQVVGILPDDAVNYTSLELIDERPARVAVQVRGALFGRPGVKVSTRYELTPCDPGVRVRTEAFNGGVDTELWSLTDGYYWSGREALPFAPGVITKDGASFSGFAYPSFGLTSINDVFRTFPYLAAAGHSNDEHIASIATASCTGASLEGFLSDQVSSAGLKRATVPPRGWQVFERFIASAPSKGVSGAVDVALEVRKQVLGESLVTLTGTVERLDGGAVGGEREASVVVAEGTLDTPAAERSQWTQVVPAADGSFSARVPAGKSYVVSVASFGQTKVEKAFASVSGDTALGTFTLPRTATVTFHVGGDGDAPLDAEVFVVPVSAAERTRLQGTLHGRFTTCSPWLGAPPGASPACNRVLVRNGVATADLPLGNYYLYAFKGPFWSLARHQVSVQADVPVFFTLKKLGLQPAGAVGADFHVHGAASFDSSIPDYDRVLSFSASDLEVIISTDHDVVHDYGQVLADLGLSATMTAVTGTETTGHIPFFYIPNYGFPLVIGHYNFWPLVYDPSKLRNGGPQDELVEPGMLFERTKPLFAPGRVSIIELNHPWADPEFGRDLGFPRALSLDMRKNLPSGTTDDGTSGGMYVRVPAGSTFANDAHHAQEVMNGSENAQFLQYRAFWHYVLNQGRLKTGTANSDSHSLTDNTVGLPRNLVTAATHGGAGFDLDALNTAVREGKVLGTNGPVITATVEADQGGPRSYGLQPFKPKAGAKVKVTVTAAPWVPVEEVRYVVNGKVVKAVAATAFAGSPFDAEAGPPRYDAEVLLSELTAGVTGDAWLVVEAGKKLPLFGDLGGGLENAPDGIPDTTDNNGDGVVDQNDVAAGAKIGPLKDPALPADGEAGFDYSNITGGHPVAFTNPFVLDLDGDGAFTAPGVKGGRP